MHAQNGRDMLIKYKDPDGAYQTLAGLRTKNLRFNARPVDVTDTESAQGWKELLPNAGVKSADISGAGIFKNDASGAVARHAFFDQAILELKFILPNFGEITGPFLVAALSYSGRYEGEARFEINLVSAGLPVFSSLS